MSDRSDIQTLIHFSLKEIVLYLTRPCGSDKYHFALFLGFVSRGRKVLTQN